MQQANILAYIRLNEMNYLQLSAIFELFTKKSNVKNLLKDYSTILIQADKLVNKWIIELKAFKHWYILKLYKMSLIQYYKKRKIKPVYLKIKLSIKIQLKTILQ